MVEGQSNYQGVLQTLSTTQKYILKNVMQRYLTGKNWGYFTQEELEHNPLVDMQDLNDLVDNGIITLSYLQEPQDKKNILIEYKKQDFINNLIYGRLLDQGINSIKGFSVDVDNRQGIFEYHVPTNVDDFQNAEYRRMMRGLKTRFGLGSKSLELERIGLYVENESRVSQFITSEGQRVRIKGYKEPVSTFLNGILDLVEWAGQNESKVFQNLIVQSPKTGEQIQINFNDIVQSLINSTYEATLNKLTNQIIGLSSFITPNEKSGIWFLAYMN